MKGTIGIGRCKGVASLAILLGALFSVFLLPASAQQDVAPSWYDPWAALNAAVTHPTPAPAVVDFTPPLVQNQLQRTEKAIVPRTAKLRLKETYLDSSLRNSAYKRTETSSGN